MQRDAIGPRHGLAAERADRRQAGALEHVESRRRLQLVRRDPEAGGRPVLARAAVPQRDALGFRAEGRADAASGVAPVQPVDAQRRCGRGKFVRDQQGAGHRIPGERFHHVQHAVVGIAERASVPRDHPARAVERHAVAPHALVQRVVRRDDGEVFAKHVAVGDVHVQFARCDLVQPETVRAAQFGGAEAADRLEAGQAQDLHAPGVAFGHEQVFAPRGDAVRAGELPGGLALAADGPQALAGQRVVDDQAVARLARRDQPQPAVRGRPRDQRIQFVPGRGRGHVPLGNDRMRDDRGSGRRCRRRQARRGAAGGKGQGQQEGREDREDREQRERILTGRAHPEIMRPGAAPNQYRFIRMKRLTSRGSPGKLAPPSRPAEGQAL